MTQKPPANILNYNLKLFDNTNIGKPRIGKVQRGEPNLQVQHIRQGRGIDHLPSMHQPNR